MSDTFPHVYIVQLLCPNRHCILAHSLEAKSESDVADAVHLLLLKADEFIGKQIINPWCGICQSTRETWTFDAGRSHWKTMEEAMPHLMAAEEAQLATAEELRRRQQSN